MRESISKRSIKKYEKNGLLVKDSVKVEYKFLGKAKSYVKINIDVGNGQVRNYKCYYDYTTNRLETIEII